MHIHQSGRFILASGSPRRSELLSMMGLDFQIVASGVDESSCAGETPRGHVLRLSREKASAVARSYPDAWVLGADTIVAAGGQVLGKPESADEAKQMLGLLSGKPHQVFTGYAVTRTEQGILLCEAVESTVFFREIAPEEIDWYTQTDEPYDKAGGYAVQGISACFIREIHGSYTNVMGLPLCEVIEALKRVSAVNFSGGDHEHLG